MSTKNGEKEKRMDYWMDANTPPHPSIRKYFQWKDVHDDV